MEPHHILCRAEHRQNVLRVFEFATMQATGKGAGAGAALELFSSDNKEYHATYLLGTIPFFMLEKERLTYKLLCL
jgi:hypothetical protein